MSRQAECVVTDEVLWGPEKGHNSKAGAPAECCSGGGLC
jgi:hypothetical protein